MDSLHVKRGALGIHNGLCSVVLVILSQNSLHFLVRWDQLYVLEEELADANQTLGKERESEYGKIWRCSSG